MLEIDTCFERYDALNTKHTELWTQLAEIDANRIKVIAQAFLVDPEAHVRFERQENGTMPKWGTFHGELLEEGSSPQVCIEHLWPMAELRFLEQTLFNGDSGIVKMVEFRLNPNADQVLLGYRKVAEL
jgi:hypothetical protein